VSDTDLDALMNALYDMNRNATEAYYSPEPHNLSSYQEAERVRDSVLKKYLGSDFDPHSFEAQFPIEHWEDLSDDEW